MDIQKRIKDISEYFIGMQVSTEDNIVYVRTRFPNNWVISDLLEENFKVKGFHDKKNNTQFFYTGIENGFDLVFDAIDFTIKMNLSALERLDLFKQKVEELKELFDNEPMDKLKRLEFSFKKLEKRKKTVKKSKQMSDELTSQITTDTANPLDAYNNNLIEEIDPSLIKEIE